jgi:hypothetical protein
MIKPEQLSILYDTTPPEEVKQRQGPRRHQGDCPKFGACPQPHMMLDYVDARYVMDKLDRLGPENWQDLFVDRPDGSVRCGIGIHVGDEWIWKWDVGTVSDIEPEKGAYSEAFKRAGVKWGIARDLYGHKAGTSQPPAQRPREEPAAARARAARDPQPTQADMEHEADLGSEDEAFDALVTGNTQTMRPAPQRAPQAVQDVPTCPVHRWDDKPRPMKPDTRASHPNEWHCTAKVGDGYCSERARA